MIHRMNRFHGHGSLQYVYKRGQTVRGASLSLRYCLNERRQTYRAAVVVSRKVSKSAVVRNRIRRRLYEDIRALSPGFKATYDLVLVVYDEKIADLAAERLAAEVTTLCKKAQVVAPEAKRHAIVNGEK